MGLRQSNPNKAQTVTKVEDSRPSKQVTQSRTGKIKSAEDIIESIAMIRDLISANSTLRDKV